MAGELNDPTVYNLSEARRMLDGGMFQIESLEYKLRCWREAETDKTLKPRERRQLKRESNALARHIHRAVAAADHFKVLCDLAATYYEEHRF